MPDVALVPNNPANGGAAVEVADPNTRGDTAVVVVNEDVVELNEDGAVFPLIATVVLKPKDNTGIGGVLAAGEMGAVVLTVVDNPNVDFAEIIAFQSII